MTDVFCVGGCRRRRINLLLIEFLRTELPTFNWLSFGAFLSLFRSSPQHRNNAVKWFEEL